MQTATFMAHCPLEIGDNVKIVLDESKKIYSESEYIVDDILCIHSIKTGIVSFKIILKDSSGLLAPREVNTLIRIKRSEKVGSNT